MKLDTVNNDHFSRPRCLPPSTIIALSLFTVLSLVCIEVSSAKPRKVLGVEWQTNWIHPGGTTIRSKDLKHLITQLPNSSAIQDDYLSFFRVNLGHGQSTVVTITPLNFQNTISCPSLSTNKGTIEGSCRAKHQKLKKFPKNTKITLKVKTPGNPPRYIYWTIKPRQVALRPKAPAQRATQIYEIGPAHMTAFIQNARIKGYTFHVIPQDHFDNPPGNLQKPGVFPLSITDPSPDPKGQLITFGNVVPQVTPRIQSLEPDTGMEVSMFAGKMTLNAGWTYLSANYVGLPGENCQIQMLYKYPGTRQIWHRFSAKVQLYKYPGARICSKLWLQNIKLKGPRGANPLKDALRTSSSRRR